MILSKPNGLVLQESSRMPQTSNKKKANKKHHKLAKWPAYGVFDDKW
jgi:hypothetical protein